MARRIRLRQFGDPSVLEVEEFATPEPPADGYVVDVALDRERGPVVIECNPITSAGRYRDNGLAALWTAACG